MINKTLSELAEAYANGDIDITTYRKNRGELLREIVAGHVPVQPIDYLPPLEIEEEAAVTQPMARDTTQLKGNSVPRGNLSDPIETTLPPDYNKSYKMLYVGVSILIVILLIVAVVMFYPEPPSSHQAQPIPSAPVEEELDENLGKPGEAIITDFLQQNVWDDNALDAFLQQWNALNYDQQIAASGTKRMQRLSSEIYRRFLEEKALMSIDSEKALSRQQKLIDFANEIGILDTRMTIE